jgi:hypothetical protein
MRRFALGTLLGVAVGLAIALFAARTANYDPTPTLTPQEFEQAYDRWSADPVANYDIEIRVTGPQASVYKASVRDGQPQAAWRNGQPLTTRRTFGTWSVPGMFSTMGRDVAALQQAAAKGTPPPLILRAAFNAQYGYPEHYRRIDNGSRKGSDAITVTWDVIKFQITPAAGQSPESTAKEMSPQRPAGEIHP